MKVVCINNIIDPCSVEHKKGLYPIDNTYKTNLTIGRTYDSNPLASLHELGSYDVYEIRNDIGQSWWYPDNLFKTVDEIREEKLIQLGINEGNL